MKTNLQMANLLQVPISGGLTMRSINWLENTSRSISSHFQKVGEKNAKYIAHRLSVVLLERLPAETAEELIAVLPQELPSQLGQLKTAAASPVDFLIGYSDFVEQAGRSFFDESIASVDSAELVADFFLWSVAQELDSDLKWKMIQGLPTDLTARMNLYTGQTDDSKVA